MITIHVPEQNIVLGNGTIAFEIKDDTPTPAPKPIPTPQRYPQGKGLLIWNLNKDYLSTVDRLVGLGIKWVAPKVVNAANSYNAQWIIPFIIECRKAGIDVWGWGYTYATNSLKEAQSTINIVNGLDISGYFIDVEGEYDKPNTAGAATTYITTLRAGTQKPLGLCSYRYPNLHLNVPWKIFLDNVDFHIPQVYILQAVSDIASSFQMGKSYIQLKTLKELPYIPIGTICKDDNSAWIPTEAQTKDFYYNGVVKLQLSGYGFYDLDSGLPNLLSVIKTLS